MLHIRENRRLIGSFSIVIGLPVAIVGYGLISGTMDPGVFMQNKVRSISLVLMLLLSLIMTAWNNCILSIDALELRLDYVLRFRKKNFVYPLDKLESVEFERTYEGRRTMTLTLLPMHDITKSRLPSGNKRTHSHEFTSKATGRIAAALREAGIKVLHY